MLTSISCDHKFIFLAKFDINKLNELLLFLLIEGSRGVEIVMGHPIASINRQELEVAHGGNEGVRDLTRFAKRVKIDTKVALTRRIHGAHKWESIAVVVQRGDVL